MNVVLTGSPSAGFHGLATTTGVQTVALEPL